MPNSKDTYSRPSKPPSCAVREDTIEYGFIGKLQSLKYEYREDICDRAALEKNFREKFEALNRVKVTEAEFARLLDEIVSSMPTTGQARHACLRPSKTSAKGRPQVR